MSRRQLALMAAAGLVLAAAVLTPAATADTPAPHADILVTYRVPIRHAQDAQTLIAAGYDVLERREGNDLFVLGDPTTADSLRHIGFSPTAVRTQPRPTPNTARPAVGDTYHGGYRTVDGNYAHLDQVAAQHPDLATVVTYGQSWRKKQDSAGGRDLKAVCVTKLRPGDCALVPNADKPRFFLMGQIHAREITTGEVALRWIDELTTQYGKDADITKLMDTTEMWVVPIANPDGVDIVASGGDNPVLHRKNANDSHGATCGRRGQIGIDLNRNSGTHWGGLGTSRQPCGQEYLGPAADSEPETTALEGLFRQLYPAVRTGTENGDPAPADARGMMITLHGDANLVLLPWGFDHTAHTGSDFALRALASELGSLTGYKSGQAGELLYDASGGTDDWTFDKLGLASFTIEVGDSDGRGCDGFAPPYSCQDSYFWPKMKPALLYAAQHAAAPYQTTVAAKG